MTNPLRSDIDNLAKSVVDTLFLALGTGKDPLPTGKLFEEVSDTRVMEVFHVKRETAGPEGAYITIPGVSWWVLAPS